jgi:hypothetical protein
MTPLLANDFKATLLKELRLKYSLLQAALLLTDRPQRMKSTPST